jgi:hypothetical protein
MTTSLLVRAAFDTLAEPGSAPGLNAVAATTLLSAMSNAVETPGGSPMLVWRWLLHSNAPPSMLHQHRIQSTEVARDAVRVLTRDADAGDDARDLALAVLQDENLEVVTEEDVLLMADNVLDEDYRRRFAHLIEGVHEQRGLAAAFLTILRDRLAAHAVAPVRATGVEVGALLPRLDPDFAARMLADRSPIVRRTVLEHLDRVEEADRGLAAKLVRTHLASREEHHTVIASALGALSQLVRRTSGH